MIKILFILIAVFFVCMPSFIGAKDLVFALVPKTIDSPFFDLARDGCKDAEHEIGNMECLYIGPGNNNKKNQIQIVQDLIKKNVDGIAISISNATEMAEIIRNTSIPIITWDSDFLSKDHNLRYAYIGSNNYNIGINLAEIVMMLKPNGGELCIQSGANESVNHNERIAGIRDTLAMRDRSKAYPSKKLKNENGWLEVDECPLYTNENSSLAVNQMEYIFTKKPNLTAFISTGGYIQFVPSEFRKIINKYSDRIKSVKTALVIADTFPTQLEDLREGRTHGQVGQQPYKMGYKAMYALKNIIDGNINKYDNNLEKVFYTNLSICLAPNIDICLLKK